LSATEAARGAKRWEHGVLGESDLFDFLAKNQQTLTWLGGGVATAAGGAWIVIKYFLNRDENENAPDKPSAGEKSGSGTHVAATFGSAAGRDLHVGDNVSIQQNKISRAGIVLAVIGLLLLGVAIMNAGHNVTVSNGNYVGGAVNNSQVGVTTTRPPDEKQK
jgi:hypothetical protein